MLKQCKRCGKDFEPILPRTIYCNACRTKRIYAHVNNNNKRKKKQRQEIIRQLRAKEVNSHEDND